MANLDFSIDTTKAKESILEIAKSFGKVKEAAQEFDDTAKKAFDATNKEAEKTNAPLKEQVGIVAKLEDRYQRLQAQMKKATSEKTIEVLNKKLKETSDEMKRLREVGVKSLDAINSEADQTAAIFEKLKGAAVAAFSVQALIEFGTILKEVTDRTDKVTSSVRNYFKGTDAEINSISKSVFSLASVLQQDEQTISRTANALAKGFGVDGVSAVNLMQEALYKSGAEAEELLTWFQEYPPNMKEAGLSLEEFLAISTQASKQGIYSDYGIATIEEGMLRLREMTPATVDALKAIDLQPVDVQKLIDEKGIFAAIQQVSGKLKTLEPDSQKVGQAIADIFGGAGEKAGYEYITFLSEMKLSLAEVEDNATELTKAKREFSELVADISFSATESGSAVNTVYTGIVKGINAVLTYVKALFDNSKPLTDVFRDLFGVVGDLWNEFAKLGKQFGIASDSSDQAATVMSRLAVVANLLTIPIKFVYSSILNAVQAFNQFIDESPNVQAAMQKIGEVFDSFVNVIKNAPAYLSGFVNAGKVAFSSFSEMAKNQLGATGDLIIGVLTFDKDKINAAQNKSKAVFSDYGKKIADAFNKSFTETQKATEAQTAEADTKTPVKKENNNLIKSATDLEQAQIDAMREGIDKRLALIEFEYAQRIAKAKQFNLDTRDLEKERNDKIKEEIKKNTAAEDTQFINRKIILSGIDTNKQVIDLQAKAVKDVNKLIKQVKPAKPKDWFSFDELKDAALAIADFFSVIADKRVESANIELDAANKEVEARQGAVDALKSDLELELQLNEQGFASNVSLKQQELEEAKKQQIEAEKQQAEALKQQAAAQKTKERIDKATQISAIMTAIAELIKNWSSLGLFGHIAGIAQVAVMLAGFAAAKKKVTKLRKGKTGLVIGASHESGGVPLSTNYEVEGGEYISVTPKSVAKEELPLLEAIRTKDKVGMYKRLRSLTNELAPSQKQGTDAVSMEFKQLRNDVAIIKNALLNKKQVFVQNNKLVTISKNSKTMKNE